MEVIVSRERIIGMMDGVLFMREVAYVENGEGEITARVVPLTKGPM